MITLTLLFLSTVSLAQTSPYASPGPGISTMEVQGKVHFAGTDQTIRWGDTIRGETGSKLRARTSTQSWTVVGPFHLSFDKYDSNSQTLGVVRLEMGKMRVQIQLPGQKPQTIPVVRTPMAVLGVRGTDFYVSHEPILGESELLSFENDVEMRSIQNDSHILVHTGYWGGIGGRFGQTLRPPFQPSAKAIQAIKSIFLN